MSNTTRKKMIGILIVLLMASCSSSNAASLQELSVENAGVTLYVRVAGNAASGNVMVAMHGGPGMTHDYMLGLDEMAGANLAVVTYDQRGIGHSSSPLADPENYTLTKYAEDLEAIRQAIGVEQIILFGHSWGGIVAQNYAVLYPDHVHSIILFGSGPPTWEGMFRCQDLLMQRIMTLTQQGFIAQNPEPGSAEAEKGYLPAYFSDPNFWFSPDDPGSAPVIDARTTLVNDLTWTANNGYDIAADISNLSLHLLNLWGEDDPIQSSAGPEISTAFSNSDVETIVFGHCGHFWHECQSQFFSALQTFLNNK